MVHRATYIKLQQHPEYLAAEVERLNKALTSPQGTAPDHYERYFYFMNPKFMSNPTDDFDYFYENGLAGGEFNGNVVKSAVGFWIRRHIDGTDRLFYEKLEELI